MLFFLFQVWDNTRGKHYVLRAIRCANSEDVAYILERSRLISEITTVPGACPYLVKMLDSFSHLVGASYVVFVQDEYCDLGTLSEEPVTSTIHNPSAELKHCTILWRTAEHDLLIRLQVC